MNKKSVIIIGLLVYLASTGISYSIFTKNNAAIEEGVTSKPLAGKVDNDYEAITFDPNKPRTEECPLNGIKYSRDQKNWWEKHRPLGVMIENHEDSRPQSGIDAADVTYEAIAEGGITRTLNVYYCNDAGLVGPVRSARTYFLDFISEYGTYPLYAHVGGANTSGPADALGQIIDYGWSQYNDLNQFSIGFPTFKRDETRLGRPVATEHTMYSITSKLWDVGKQRKLTEKDKEGARWDEDFVKYSFKEEEPEAKRGNTKLINIEFWNNSNYFVDWVYDKKANLYLRKNGGVEHIDRNTKKQLSTKNLVILYMTEGRANDGYEGNAHMLYGTRGTGKASVFIDGKEIKGTWKKSNREGRTTLTDSSGKEIKFNRGKIWFQVQATDGVVVVK
ncbi:MAG TPA: DUF3048 domain-containing protein [Candidatus Limnocylindrales bacterium]|nr:DUF3048 domain-containing protein [Candidatus Limnocylindrales bacterium]